MLDNTPDTLTLKELEELLQIGKTSLVDWELTYFSAIEKILFLRH